MNRIRNLFFYIGIIAVFSLIMYLIIYAGKDLETGKNVLYKIAGIDQKEMVTGTIQDNLKHPLAVLLFQIVLIIITARFFSWICRKIKQPAVIGEILAGIVLGPSVIGMYFPEFSGIIFPQQSLGNLQLISQFGLILFMFVIGMELDLKVIKNQAHEAVVVSHASIIIPFALGLGLAYLIYETFAPQGVAFISFSLFIGISLSITAFPVLARIVQERGIYKTPLGAIVITCAAVDDITAWSLLACVIAIVKAGTLISALPTILLGVVYVVIMLKVVKPFLKRIGDLHTSSESISKSIVAIFFLVLILSSYTTEIIGIHALFGAFMAGLVMPEDKNFKQIFTEKVEDVALVLLLPLFFVFTGLRTQIGLLNEPYLWKICAFVVLVAIVGKFAGSALAAKFVGQNWKDSLTIGVLMNTRGLVELVALNIGYDLGVLTPEMFSILVIMALVTTFMTSPTLDLIDRIFGKSVKVVIKESFQSNKLRILISFARPEMGRILLRLANALGRSQSAENVKITAMHLFPGNLFNEFKIENIEEKNFVPIMAEAQKLKLKINTIFKVTEDIVPDIAEEANKGEYDMLLVGIGQSIYQGTLLGKLFGFVATIVNPNWLKDKLSGREKLFELSSLDERTRHIISSTRIPVGILLDKGLQHVDHILLPIFNAEDTLLLDFTLKLVFNSKAHIQVLDIANQISTDSVVLNKIKEAEEILPGQISITNIVNIDEDFMLHHDLMVTSIESWKKLDGSKSQWYSDAPSILILKLSNKST